MIQHYEQQGGLPNSILLSGPQGLGKHIFAQQLAAYLLCDTPLPDNMACQQCRHCQLFNAGTHPDAIILSPEKEGGVIKVDDVRQQIATAYETPQVADKKIIVLNPADAMNRASANALLKILEEPSDYVFFILVTHQPHKLLPTIRSRCQNIIFPLAHAELGQRWLQENVVMDEQHSLAVDTQRPFYAYSMLERDILPLREQLASTFVAILSHDEDPIPMAELCSKHNGVELLHWFYTWLTDCLILQNIDSTERVRNYDILAHLQNIAKKLSSVEIFAYIDRITHAKKLINQGANVNQQLVFEGIFAS